MYVCIDSSIGRVRIHRKASREQVNVRGVQTKPSTVSAVLSTFYENNINQSINQSITFIGQFAKITLGGRLSEKRNKVHLALVTHFTKEYILSNSDYNTIIHIIGLHSSHKDSHND